MQGVLSITHDEATTNLVTSIGLLGQSVGLDDAQSFPRLVSITMGSADVLVPAILVAFDLAPERWGVSS
jgi:hypothetical protein